MNEQLALWRLADWQLDRSAVGAGRVAMRALLRVWRAGTAANGNASNVRLPSLPNGNNGVRVLAGAAVRTHHHVSR